jgi:hypothetical protein
VVVVVAVLRLGAPVAAGRGGGLLAARISAGPGGRGCCHAIIIFHIIRQHNATQ